MKRLPRASLCFFVLLFGLFLPGTAPAAPDCPPFTERSRTIPAGKGRRAVLLRPACLDKQAREKERSIPLPPKCPDSGTPVHRFGRWECREAR